MSWIGVDFDGTLVKKCRWWGLNDGTIGEPIWPMIERVKQWLEDGKEVRILTARVARGFDSKADHWVRLSKWSVDTFGQQLEVTSEKDPHMIELWDDRAVQVEPDTGYPIDGRP